VADLAEGERDGVSLQTRYTRAKKDATYEVLSVEMVLFRAPLVTPPPFTEPRASRDEYLVLNDDVYGSF